MPAPQAALEVRTSGGLSAFKALPALWWMAHRVVEAGQGFDLVHANSQKAFIAAALAVDRSSSSYLASTRHFNRTPL